MGASLVYCSPLTLISDLSAVFPLIYTYKIFFFSLHFDSLVVVVWFHPPSEKKEKKKKCYMNNNNIWPAGIFTCSHGISIFFSCPVSLSLSSGHCNRLSFSIILHQRLFKKLNKVYTRNRVLLPRNVRILDIAVCNCDFYLPCLSAETFEFGGKYSIVNSLITNTKQRSNDDTSCCGASTCITRKLNDAIGPAYNVPAAAPISSLFSSSRATLLSSFFLILRAANVKRSWNQKGMKKKKKNPHHEPGRLFMVRIHH